MKMIPGNPFFQLQICLGVMAEKIIVSCYCLFNNVNRGSWAGMHRVDHLSGEGIFEIGIFGFWGLTGTPGYGIVKSRLTIKGLF